MKTKYYNSTGFLDLLFNALLGVCFLFILSFLLIAPPTEEDLKKPNAEFLITLTWNHDYDDDVDIWLQDPIGNILFFRKKEIGLMHLDRDDIGKQRDMVITTSEIIVKEINQEIVTIRGFIAGEWILNLHMYAKRDPDPANVYIRMDKLNPSFKTVLDKEYTMKEKWEEITVTRFTMTANGKLTDWEKLPKSLVTERLQGFEGTGP